ncbi:hypothetical protein SAMN05444266_101618 [Chitinophaga jiangningensis]|uniref:Uncharacterized protein n=1 Tax=Chitinophaga jiangningensis TaxID=1419482 RepID=A0A1M6WGE6_9BACT|nr:hypothetical protein [Chitinophaga jiangningensis]SHK92863.1 hypothetical protein SAMN05444266_101618 [Chitinophaga jiangningensis]
MEVPGVYQIPNGPKNLETLFPDLDWPRIAEYFIEVLNAEEAVVATCGRVIHETYCENIRIHFINYLGGVDAINFELWQETHKSQSESWQALSSNIKREGGTRRFKVTANDTYRVTTIVYSEAEMEWLKEVLDSPMAWMEWKGVQGQADDYLPITIVDSSVVTRAVSDRYQYEFTIEYTMSNSDLTIRN